MLVTNHFRGVIEKANGEIEECEFSGGKRIA